MARRRGRRTRRRTREPHSQRPDDRRGIRPRVPRVSRRRHRRPAGRLFVVELCAAEPARVEGQAHRVVLPRTAVPRPVIVAAGDDGGRGVFVLRHLEGMTGATASSAALIGPPARSSRRSPFPMRPGGTTHSARRFRPRSIATAPDHPRAGREVHRRHADLFDLRSRTIAEQLADSVDARVDGLWTHRPRSSTAMRTSTTSSSTRPERRASWIGRTHRWPPDSVDVARCLLECLTPGQRRRTATSSSSATSVGRSGPGVRGSPIEALSTAVELAHLGFLPGVVRWGAVSPSVETPDRPARLLRDAFAGSLEMISRR